MNNIQYENALRSVAVPEIHCEQSGTLSSLVRSTQLESDVTTVCRRYKIMLKKRSIVFYFHFSRSRRAILSNRTDFGRNSTNQNVRDNEISHFMSRLNILTFFHHDF